MSRPQRVSVVGNSGSGKSTLGRLVAARIDAPYVELDSLFHLPGWGERPADEFSALVSEQMTGDRWVIDGNYRAALRGLVWTRADTVVWLDLPRSRIMRQVVVRTLRRTLTRQELWNGNREPLSNLYRLDPKHSIIRWSWTQHQKYVDRYEAAMVDPELRHLTFVRLRSHAEAGAWLDRL